MGKDYLRFSHKARHGKLCVKQRTALRSATTPRGARLPWGGGDIRFQLREIRAAR